MNQVFQIQLEHAPPFGPVVVHQIVTVLKLEFFLVLGGVDALAGSKIKSKVQTYVLALMYL